MRSIFTRATASAALLALLAGAAPAAANPTIVIDAASGETLVQQEATRPWYPASLTKLMTAFVALKAVREGRITLDTPLKVSARATSMAPSKMGFRPGTLVTLDNALKMLMVKSANDIAVTIAEGVSGSVEAFANEMNASASALGMRESHFTNPNGLPDSRQVSSARDMAVLGRALYVYFPDQAGLFDIGALRLGKRDKFHYTIRSSGEVVLTRAEASEGADPVLGQFLGFLARDIANHPERLQAVDAGLVQRLQSLVGSVEVDLNAALSADDE